MITINIKGPQGSGKSLLIAQFEEVLKNFKIDYIIENNEHLIEILSDDVPFKITEKK